MHWITNWLLGMLAVASVVMCVGLYPLVMTELHDGRQYWLRNKALRFSAALVIHAVGAIMLFTTPALAWLPHGNVVALYVAWGAMGLWLLAKTMIVSVSGGLRICLALFVVWTALVTAVRVFWQA